MQDQLVERAAKAIAESERLMDKLYTSIVTARQLDERLHCLHHLRIAEMGPTSSALASDREHGDRA